MDIRTNRGSVLMEFIIVLPLYFVLLGTAFFFGDLSLHAVNMAASGDRTLAVSHGLSEDSDDEDSDKGWNAAKAMPYIAGALSLSSNNEEVVSKYIDNAEEDGIEETASSYSYEDTTNGTVADKGFKGSWTWLVGSTLSDDYALSPITRTFVRAWKVFADAAEMTEASWAADREYEDDSVLHSLFPSAAKDSDSVGRIEGMVSKDLEDKDGVKRTYAYYTLMRNSKGRKSYRYLEKWDAGGLVDDVAKDATWNTKVFGEEFFFDKPKGEEGEERGYGYLGTETHRGADAGPGKSRDLYDRYGQFITWSD